MKKPSFVIIGLAVALLAMLSDQASKWLMLEGLKINETPIEVAPFFNLVLVWNHGISFGMFAGHNQPLLLIAMALAITAIMLRWLGKAGSLHLAVAIGLVIGGALGNVIDRARFGAVADFLDFHIGMLHWPAFNIADSCIFIGVVVLCIDSMVDAKKK